MEHLKAQLEIAYSNFNYAVKKEEVDYWNARINLIHCKIGEHIKDLKG